ncbi:MAG: aldo/keto reductase [Candidatus Nanohaloarchaeota archaeon QJJ-7]|nr:aldo/keto reductase [Candidatus Nanohaloarchaeota archaeon QJJ-7]
MEFKNAKGMAIPSIGLGTWQLKGNECEKAVANALEMGYRHIDTAEMYENEERVGNGITNADVDREDIFLTTKVWRTNLEPDSVRKALEGSLEKLETDYVDLLLIHWPNENMPVKKTLDAMHELVDEGRVRNIGVSNFTTELLDEALDADEEIKANQVEKHIHHQQGQMTEYCQENDLVLTAYSPLARGRASEEVLMEEIGENHGKTAVQVALRWLVQQENVVAIPKAAPEDYQRENLDVFDFELSEEDMEQIEDLEKNKRYVDPGFAPW